MDETNEESPSQGDLSAEIRGCAKDCSCHREDMQVSVPICFLVKEQAKSFIAIQELQNRLNRVEKIQEDVIDAVIEFRNYLSDSKSFNTSNRAAGANFVGASPGAFYSEPNEVSKSSPIHVPYGVESSVEDYRPNKTRSHSLKESYPSISNFQTSESAPEHLQKLSDMTKNKDCALESDKQDSGLDSDCRDNPSLNRNNLILINPESNDELLVLLDEIGNRSILLQKKLAIAGEDVTKVLKDASSCALSVSGKSTSEAVGSQMHQLSDCSISQFGPMPDPQRKLTSTTIFEEGDFIAQGKVPNNSKHHNISCSLSESAVCDNTFVRRRCRGIDGTAVSAILKENSVVDLQRKALVYLVDNAVLQTKLQESEFMVFSRKSDSDKLENTLKEEARLLMMENRELRISLHEQHLETSSLKSRLTTMEKALHSVTCENQELNRQLGETFHLQNLADGSAASQSRELKSSGSSKSAPSPRHSFRKDVTVSVNCVKSKLLSDNSSFLDITIDESSENLLKHSQKPGMLSKRHAGQIISSTPVVPYQKQKEMQKSLWGDSHIFGDSPANFHDVKKCLQSSYCSENCISSARIPQSRRSGGDACGDVRSETRNQKDKPIAFSADTLPSQGIGKFPFNTILEKLKANSEHRLNKSATAQSVASFDKKTNETVPKPGVNKSIGISSQGTETVQLKETKLSQSLSDAALQRKKGKNIQQRIQNILDRIVAESEETS